jgi:hypothetical protein
MLTIFSRLAAGEHMPAREKTRIRRRRPAAHRLRRTRRHPRPGTADGQVDPAPNSELDLRLTHGSFRLSIAALDKKFVKAAAHEPVYPKTCTDLVTVTGATPIVAGSGTGAYRGVRGSFPVTLTLNEVEARPCQPSPGAFRAQLITVAGSGTIWF